MKILYFFKRIGLIEYSDDEINDYYISKQIIKKYGKQYKEIMRMRKKSVK